jgi:hypothetical protein
VSGKKNIVENASGSAGRTCSRNLRVAGGKYHGRLGKKLGVNISGTPDHRTIWSILITMRVISAQNSAVGDFNMVNSADFN